MGKRSSDFHRVLVPVKGLPGDAHALSIVSRLIEPKDAELTAVYVIEVAQTLPLDADLPSEVERGEAALYKAQKVAKELCGSRANFISTDLLQARSAGSAIVDEAIGRNCDLIVMSTSCTHHHGKVRVSETVDYVLTHAPCEVMLLSAPCTVSTDV